MPIVLPADLPAATTLRHDGIGVLERPDMTRRTLQVALINLMPDRPTTETQFARLLGSAGLDVALTLVIPDSHDPKTTPAAHIDRFYRRWSEIAARPFDGLIVTGAPIEHLPFADVHYWTELRQIFDWARTRLRGSYYVCWAAQAALKHFYGVEKHALPEKAFGVFPQRVTVGGSALMRGLGEMFPTPVSRHTEVGFAEIPWRHGLLPLAASPRSGLCLAEDRPSRAVYMFNHLEYDADTLRREYERDRAAGLPIAPPVGYFPGDDPARAPVNTWRRAGETLIGNWLADLAMADSIRPSAAPRLPSSRPWLNIGRRAAPGGRATTGL